MREDIGFADAAFEVTKGVIFAGVGLDNSEVIVGALGAMMLHGW